MFVKKFTEFLLEVRDKKVHHAGDKEEKKFKKNPDGSDVELEKEISDELETVTEDCPRCGEHYESCKCPEEDPWSTQNYHRVPKGEEHKEKPKQQFKK
mgnify:CR=1 FL=1